MKFLCIALLSATIVLALPIPTAFSISSHAHNRLSHISPIWRDDDLSHHSNNNPQQAPFSDTAAAWKEPDPSLGPSSTYGSAKGKKYVTVERPTSSLTATTPVLEEAPTPTEREDDGNEVAAMVAM